MTSLPTKLSSLQIATPQGVHIYTHIYACLVAEVRHDLMHDCMRLTITSRRYVYVAGQSSRPTHVLVLRRLQNTTRRPSIGPRVRWRWGELEGRGGQREAESSKVGAKYDD